MNAKKKIFRAITTMVVMIFIVVAALVFAIFSDDIKSSAYAKSFNSYGVAATVSGNVYSGANVSAMSSGDDNKIVFNSYDNESSPALSPTENIVLTSTRDYVVFEYVFENNSDSVSFITRITNFAAVENMDISYGFSYSKLEDYEHINDLTVEYVPLIAGNGNTLYFYIKVKVSNLNKASSLNGEFCFSLTAADVYEVKLYNELEKSSTYVSLGLVPNSVEIPQKEGYIFKGYYTNENGTGIQVFDENGNALDIWAQDSDDTLYAYFEMI